LKEKVLNTISEEYSKANKQVPGVNGIVVLLQPFVLIVGLSGLANALRSAVGKNIFFFNSDTTKPFFPHVARKDHANARVSLF